jgi:putative endonuclease
LCEEQVSLYLLPKIKEFGELAESPQNCGVKVACPAGGGECGGLVMYYVYILKSEKHNRYYIGCTSNLERRIDEYNKGTVSSTKAFVSWSVVYIEKYISKSEAYAREHIIKSYKSGNAFKDLIKNSESWQSG